MASTVSSTRGAGATSTGSTLSSVGTTFWMRPSSPNVRRSIVVSRWVPSPPGIAKRW
ncbi:Uncharacterised protein [Mycobacteroides abscessus]|nr:Uncharacterised protein [Mycobacteroides abscessus]